MSEVLSQSEIDALLNAVSSGELDVHEMKEQDEGKKIKKYDFKNPQKISKEQLRTLEIIHENFGRYMQTFLTGYLRTSSSVEVLTVDQFAYSEFSNAITTPAFLSIIDFYPLNGEILIEISNDLAYTMIDRLLGGDGKEQGDFKSFTEIELTLLRDIMNKMMGDLTTAWENVIELKPVLNKVEVNPQFAQIVPPNETIALVTMSIDIGGKQGMMNICLPHILLKPIIDKLNTRYWFSSSRTGNIEESREIMEERINDTVVPIIAELGKTTVTVKDILNMNKGDVIKLNGSKEDKIGLKIGSNTKFQGEIGSIGNKLAVKIKKVKKEGETINE